MVATAGALAACAGGELAVAAGTANLADARSLGASYLFSTDTDDNDIHRHTVNGWEPVSAHFDIGASA
ncbi:hypothetical protein L6R53_28180, partial [Myxococcota bacterium]|nr:hypothetical protein [Myxococcota bacterium]